MPELPETETIARDLQRLVLGAQVRAVQVARTDVLRETDATTLAYTLHNRTIGAVWRRAKLIVLDFVHPSDAIVHLVVQPRFTGALLVDDGTLEAALRDYVCLTMELVDARALHYRDVRRLGTVALMPAARFAEYAGALGMEPLTDACTPASMAEAFGRSTRAIKAALMDQSRLAGLGNIYATETCWEAAIDPSRVAASLSRAEWARVHAAMRRLLHASIAARGTSFRDYRDATGERGAFVAQLNAYGRAGERCVRCEHTLIGTAAVDGRMTVLCAWCQR